VVLLLTIGTCRIDGTVATMFVGTVAMAEVVAMVEAWASLTGVPGAGIRGLVAPVTVLPWFDIGASQK
jgi:hypothetical protein